MKNKTLKHISGLLIACIIIVSSATACLASDIFVLQDTNISVEQKTKTKDTKTEEEPAAEVEEEPVAEAEEPITEAEEPVTEIEEPAAETEEPAAEIEEPVTETDEPITEPEEEPVTETEGSETNINVDNTNYVEINNNTGTVYVNIYNGVDVDVTGNTDSEADVSVSSDNEILVADDNSEPATELTTDEEYTEQTTVAVRPGQSSSGRGRGAGMSSSRVKRNNTKEAADDTIYTSEAKEEADYNAEATPVPEETLVINQATGQKAVCLTIGSPRMNIDGKIVETDAAPYISQGYTLVPLRCVSTVFDADVQWDAYKKTAIIEDNGVRTEFTIGSDTMSVNGKIQPIAKSAEIKDGRTYVPLRSLGEALGAKVTWIPDSKSILILK